MSEPFDPVTSVADAEVREGPTEGAWAGSYQVMTPNMRAAGGSLGVARNVLPPGAVGCPFHWHAREDEVFYVLEGRGVLRYGDEVREIGPGDCISCPSGTKVAHQIANPFDANLVYLGMGPYDPHEVCGYPDNGKVMVRSIATVGQLEERDYMDGEPEPPEIFALFAEKKG